MHLHRRFLVPLAAARCAAGVLGSFNPTAQAADSEPLRVVDHAGKHADILVGDRVIEIPQGETTTLRYRFRIIQGKAPAPQTLSAAAKSSN